MYIVLYLIILIIKYIYYNILSNRLVYFWFTFALLYFTLLYFSLLFMKTTEFLDLIKKNKQFTYSNQHRFYKASDSEWCLIAQGNIVKVYKWTELIDKLDINKITL